MLTRRGFLETSLGVAALGANAVRLLGKPGDKFRWACTSGMFKDLPNQPDDTLKLLSEYGFEGLECSTKLEQSCRSVHEFKAKLDQYKIACANYWGVGDYYDPANPEKVRATVADNISIARDHIAVCGGKYMKVNLTMRDMKVHPMPNWWTDKEMAVLAKTLNEIGKGCADVGVKFCFHPHNWTLIDTDDREVKRIMAMTDPKLVYMVADTAHLSLGGTDPVKFVKEWFPRIGDVHFKDVIVKYSPTKSAWKGPAPGMDDIENLYKPFGTGGVDFVAFTSVLRERGYDGWVSLDFDAGKGGTYASVAEFMGNNRKYLMETLHANLRSARS
jgi:inosose dehydratase